MTKISVFGLGYVGCVTAACLATEGHDIIGVDINRQKVDKINSGEPTVIEEGITPLIKRSVKNGKLRATMDVMDAIANSEISLICVGTPSNPDGSIDLSYIKRVCKDIGEVLASKKDHTVVIRSTIFPGSTENVLVPIIEDASKKKSGKDFGICVNPEFMREGSSVSDFYNPELIVIGSIDKSGDHIQQIYDDIKKIKAPLIRTDIKTAEFIKYVNNSFHALKVCFSNEIGRICKKLGIDGNKIMDIFCMDKKLNLSSYYLKPGLPFGGSCLPKDLQVLVHNSKKIGLDCPILESITNSNQKHLENCIKLILEQRRKKIGILGLAFKAGTDDIRGSPNVEIAESLIRNGCEIAIYDSNVSIENLFGSNRAFIEKKIPKIASLMATSIKEVIDRSEVLVIAQKSKEFENIAGMMREDQILVDFVKIAKPEEVKGKYVRLC
jgi:GDP-mannose 6-dehydrogenase